MRTTKLPKDTTRFDSREFELTILEDGITLEREWNYMYDYECITLNKEQALQLANAILECYNKPKEV